MYLILVYDISVEDNKGRISKVMKKCREYLHHTQKSVFEGEITEAKLFKLKKELKKMIDNEKDYIVFYTMENKNNLKRENLGIDFDPTSNIL